RRTSRPDATVSTCACGPGNVANTSTWSPEVTSPGSKVDGTDTARRPSGTNAATAPPLGARRDVVTISPFARPASKTRPATDAGSRTASGGTNADGHRAGTISERDSSAPRGTVVPATSTGTGLPSAVSIAR